MLDRDPARLFEQFVAHAHVHDERVDAAQHGVYAIQALDSDLSPLLLSDVFADACRSDHIAGSRPQHRIVPANEPTLARTCEDLVLVMPCFGQVGEESREKRVFQIVNFGRYEKLEPVSPDNFLVSPTGQAEEVLVAVGDPRFAVKHQ